MRHSKKGRVHHRLPDAVLHHLVTGLMGKNLIRIGRWAVFLNYVIQKLHFLQVIVDKSCRQVHIVTTDIVADRRLRTTLVPFRIISEVHYCNKEVANEKGVFSGVFYWLNGLATTKLLLYTKGCTFD